MQLSMKGRTALVTGASLGIGRAISEAFAGAGASVAMVARRADVLDKAVTDIMGKSPTGKVVAIAGDVGSAEGCAKAYADAEKALGKIDVLVNNAGSSKRGPFLEHTDEIWQADLDLKLFAAIRLCRLAIPGMRQRKWGRVINVLNTGAKAAPAEGSPTAVTRAAGMSLTKAMASEFACDNVLVNALLVGRIESDQWVRRAEAAKKPLSEIYADMGKTIPIGRVGTAEEFASAALYLAADNGGSYITGTAINIDGGLCPVV